MRSVQCVPIFWVVNASSGEKSCLQFSMPTGSGLGGEGGVAHRLKEVRSLRVNIDRTLIFRYDLHEHFMQLTLKFGQYLQHSLFIT